MARTVQKETTHTEQKKEPAPANTKAKTDHKSGEELKAEMDALLDEIDEVLASNDLVDPLQFHQKGGE